MLAVKLSPKKAILIAPSPNRAPHRLAILSQPTFRDKATRRLNVPPQCALGSMTLHPIVKYTAFNGKLRPIMQSRTLRESKIASTGRRSQQRNRKNTEELLYHLGHSAVDLYIRTMLRVDIRWHAPLPSGPKILAVNHPTTTDPIYPLGFLPEPVSFLITAASFDVPIFGRLLRDAGHLPAIRSSAGATVDVIAWVALRTRAPAIPIGISLQRDRIHVRQCEAGIIAERSGGDGVFIRKKIVS